MQKEVQERYYRGEDSRKQGARRVIQRSHTKTSLVLFRQDKEKAHPTGEGTEVTIMPQRHQQQHDAGWSPKQILMKVIPLGITVEAPIIILEDPSLVFYVFNSHKCKIYIKEMPI